MNVQLTDWHASADCTWCEKEKESVSVKFQNGFLNGILCFSCLQRAIKVQSRQQSEKKAQSPTLDK